MKVSLKKTKTFAQKMPASSFKNVIINEADEIELQDLISKVQTWEILLNQETNQKGAGRQSSAPEVDAPGKEVQL